MKKYINNNITTILKTLVIGSALSLAFSCTDFLEPNPKTFESKESFFQSEDQFLQATHGVYARLQDWVLQSHVIEEGRSDNTTFDNLINLGVLQYLVRIDWFVTTATEVPINTAWNTIFQGIKETNETLAQIPGAMDQGILTDDMGRRLEGELRFIRAYLYFTAYRIWKNIPLITEPITDGLDAFGIEQTDPSAVVASILSDVETAVANLPSQYSGANLGRVTKRAAMTLQAKVHMWEHSYDQAEAILRQIVASNQYELLNDYSDIFDPANKFNVESIFEVSFKEGSEGESSNFIYQFAPVGSFPTVIPTLVGDGTWGKNIVTRELEKAYDVNDLRKNASIGYFDRSDIDSIPYIRKWDEATDANFPRTNHNWIVYRYADVLLMLAKSIIENGGNAEEAIALVNQVRARAGLSGYSSGDFANTEALDAAILNERRFELAFENHRWYDLIEYGVMVERMRAHGQHEKDFPTTPITPIIPLDPRAYMVEDYMEVLPIPSSELIVNPNMNQNPGY